MKNRTAFLFVFSFFIFPFFSREANAQSKNANEVFPKGEAAPAKNFTGKVWLYPLVADDKTFNLVMGSVTFEKGARSNWHSHPAGQILLVTNGTGYHQQRGKPIEVIKKGDVIKSLPGVEHWHGASKQSAMTHVSVNPNTENSAVTWLLPVTDLEYNNLKN